MNEYYCTYFFTRKVFAFINSLYYLKSSFQKNGSLTAICSIDGNIVLFDIQTGKLLAKHKLQGQVFSSPIMISHEGNIQVVVGCRDDYVYCLKVNEHFHANIS